MGHPPEPLAALPPDFVARLRELADVLGAPVLAHPRSRPVPVFRTNPLRGDPERTVAALRGAGLTPVPVPGLPGAYEVPEAQRDALTRSRAAEDGAIYVQGASSQRCARLLGAEPGERILDLAAAPGGKTLLLAAQMQDRGEIVAVEAVRKRFFRLTENLARAGVGCVRAHAVDGRRLPRSWDGTFDRVLLDAPCSSEARIDPGVPASFERWSLRKVRDMARKQWGLLGTAIRCVRPGGTIVYATCSFAPEENEATVAAHVGGDAADVDLVDVDLGDGVDLRPGLTRWGRKRWPDQLERARRILPDERHEGFFVAVLRRREPERRGRAAPRR